MHEGIGVPDAQTASIFEPGDEAHGLPPVSWTPSYRIPRQTGEYVCSEASSAASTSLQRLGLCESAVARVVCAGRNECAWGSGKSTRKTVPVAKFRN